MYTYIRDYAGRTGRVVQVAIRQPSFFARLAAYLAIILGLVLLLIIIVPLIVCGIVFAVGMWAYIRIRRFFGQARQPNGVFDGRRNVRVIMRGEDEPGV